MRGNRVYVGAGPWTKEQDDVLREGRAMKTPWKDIAAKIEETFGVRRTSKSLQTRFDVIRKQDPEPMNLRSKISWTAEHLNWLREKAHGKKVNWNDITTQFKARFGGDQSRHSLRSKYRRMLKGQTTTEGDATGKEDEEQTEIDEEDGQQSTTDEEEGAEEDEEGNTSDEDNEE